MKKETRMKKVKIAIYSEKAESSRYAVGDDWAMLDTIIVQYDDENDWYELNGEPSYVKPDWEFIFDIPIELETLLGKCVEWTDPYHIMAMIRATTTIAKWMNKNGYFSESKQEFEQKISDWEPMEKDFLDATTEKELDYLCDVIGKFIGAEAEKKQRAAFGLDESRDVVRNET